MITIESDVKLDYSDVLLVPKQSDIKSRKEVNINHWGFVPIIAANMDHVGTFEMAKVLAQYGILTCLVKHYTNKQIIGFLQQNPYVSRFVFISTGIKEQELDNLDDLMEDLRTFKALLPFGICIDVANGYTDAFAKAVKRVVYTYGSICEIMAGNVVTADVAQTLFDMQVGLVKVGIGPGSACSTRREAGVGYPQFSAVMECSKVAKVCADGGITCPGDVVKALAAGADFVMIGGEFAGHDEGYVDLAAFGDKLPFHGMASKVAQDAHNGGLADYRAVEGKNFNIPRRGPIKNTIKHYLGGLRSGMAYAGAHTLADLRRNAHFVKVNNILNTKYDSYQI